MRYDTIKTNKKKNIKIYVDDWYILRNANSKSIADAIHGLILGKNEDIKEYIKYYMETELKPYIDER